MTMRYGCLYLVLAVRYKLKDNIKVGYVINTNLASRVDIICPTLLSSPKGLALRNYT